MTALVLYGIGSSLVAEYEESCARAGREIALGVVNHPSEPQSSPALTRREREDLRPEDRAHPFLVPMFTPANRRRAVAEAEAEGFAQAATLVDPTSIVPASTSLAPGCYVNAGCVVGAACTFGPHVTINRGGAIGHHNRLAAFVSIGPGCVTCGEVTIGEGTVIGAGSVLLPGVTIGAGCIIGAGSLISRDVPDATRVIQKRDARITALDG